MRLFLIVCAAKRQAGGKCHVLACALLSKRKTSKLVQERSVCTCSCVGLMESFVDTSKENHVA